jgi:Cdc6-like AAA superfamily ATPase
LGGRLLESGDLGDILCTSSLSSALLRHYHYQTEDEEVADDNSVVLMDELDQLLTAKQDVVYNFFNWPTMRDSQLFVIAVANRMDLPQHLAAKIKSRLGQSSLSLLRYEF